VTHPIAGAPQFVAHDLGLDFINTAYGPSSAPVEVLVDDASVIHWLVAAGALEAAPTHVPRGLAQLAVALRDEVRDLLSAAQAGGAFQAPVVNRVLEEGRPRLQLVASPGTAAPRVVQSRRNDSAESLLEPVAAAVAQLLSGADLGDVRQCEAHDCSLVFHDTTKSRKRRWCSMAQCGNRMKVAAYRSRRSAG